MNSRSSRLIPVYLSAGVIVFACLLHAMSLFLPSFDLFKRLEWMTYDWRVRQALNFPKPEEVSTNLAAVFIDDQSLSRINEGFAYSWPWPRKLHAQLVSRLQAGGARAIGFDILFHERHAQSPDTDVQLQPGVTMGSDAFFATRVRHSDRVILAAFGETIGNQWQAIMPASLFRTNALAVAHATSEKDSDGVLRRVKAYRDDPTHGRIWHLGIVMAAQQLGINLDHAEIHADRIILHGNSGIERIIPTDPGGFFYINWNLVWNDRRIVKSSFEQAAGMLPVLPENRPDWHDKLVFVGSIGSGNNISDIGTTPLAKDTYLLSNHWNVANALLTGRFIERSSTQTEFALLILLGCYSSLLTWRARPPWPSVLILLTALAYIAAAVSLYLQQRYWLPIVLPVIGGLVMPHVLLVIYQVFFEQREKRHVKQVFARLVSPDVVNELLLADRLNLGGARRKITVLFTDVRGFTEMTDTQQAEAEAYVQSAGLVGPQAEAYYDLQASDTLSNVNDYLATIADVIKQHSGTLDKYIGDCVMAFWGAPTPNPQHAVASVEAAIQAQRAVHALNLRHMEENKARALENEQRAASNQPPLPLLPMFSIGTGINTGSAIVGLMGSEDHILNYTVFGRDVNVANRLETVAGRGRIIIGESTFRELELHHPELAASCVAMQPVMVKGIRTPVNAFEVPWRSEAKTIPLYPEPPAAEAV